MNHETDWVVSDPRYDADQLNPKLIFAYWEGHRDFAYDLLQFVRPERLVELGSQYGCSLFTFCQAVRDFKLNTEINAVDMWSGDIGAEITGEEVYALVKKTAATYYPEVNLHLFQMCFDDARPNFADNSIDILHIDGGHTFEDVEHDFTTWLPKLKENGIVLFHDVYSPIDQCSCAHWEKTKKEYDCYFDFTHSCGLGILFPKGRYWYDRLEAAGFFKYYKDLYFYRSKYKYTQARFDELKELYEERYRAIEQQSKMIDERDVRIAADERLVADKDAAIAAQAKLIDERERSLAEAHKIAEERLGIVQQQGNIIQTLQQQNAEYEAIIKRHWMSRREFRRKYGEEK